MEQYSIKEASVISVLIMLRIAGRCIDTAIRHCGNSNERHGEEEFFFSEQVVTPVDFIDDHHIGVRLLKIIA